MDAMWVGVHGVRVKGPVSCPLHAIAELMQQHLDFRNELLLQIMQICELLRQTMHIPPLKLQHLLTTAQAHQLAACQPFPFPSPLPL
jgi:hypothetical protein